MTTKTRVAIVGAGPAGLAAALGLTATEELRAKYHVTLFQPGWRAGGKCATGRTGPADVIDQNGTHYFFGCYDNTFTVTRQVYEELNNQWADFSFGTFDGAFIPRQLMVFKQFFRGRWTDWRIEIPTNTERVGYDTGILEPYEYIEEILQALLSLITGSSIARRLIPDGHPIGFVGELEAVFDRAVDAVAAEALKVLLDVHRKGAGDEVHHQALHDKSHGLRAWLWRVFEPLIRRDLDANRLWILFDMGLSTIIGMIADDIVGKGFDSVDAYEFREWLDRHGAQEITMWSPPVTTWYDAVAAYEQGSREKPNISAAVAMKSISRAAFSYKGSFTYQMEAEVGDSVVAPMIQLLQYRGVDVKWFHRVWDLVPEGEHVEKIVVEEQVKLAVDVYDPFVRVKHRRCWPDEPDWSQIATKKAKGHDLESFYTTWRGEMKTLVRGKDFDEVVCAMPVQTLPFCAPSLVADSEVLQRLGREVHAVETRTVRLFFKPTLAEIGWHGPSPVLSAYGWPFNTWEDNGHLALVENWPKDQTPQAIATLFGPMDAPLYPPGPEDQDYAPAQQAVAEQSAFAWCENDVGALWPDATSARNPLGVDWDKLVDLDGGVGPERFKFQQVRGNAGPNERYTLAAAGTLAARPRAHESGYTNLALAGDWVRNGLDVGSAEGAVMAGLQASRAICGSPKVVYGEDEGQPIA